MTVHNLKLTASIVVFNTKPDIFSRCVGCVMDSPVEFLYIIDHSPDGHYEAMLPVSPKIIYLREKNVGYGAGNNRAIRLASAADAEFHLVLNPDVYWDNGVIEELLVFMEANNDVGLSMPKIRYPDGSLQYQAKLLPTPADMLMKRFSSGKLFSKRIERNELRFTGCDTMMNVPFLSGCCMMLRMSALEKVGVFDERFFLYCEDIDLTRRMHLHYRTVYYPHATVFHELARESAKDRRMFLIHIRSAVRYFNKWGWFTDKQRELFNRRLIEEFKIN